MNTYTSWLCSHTKWTHLTKKGLNIELTDLQYEYLHELVMFAYEMDTPDQKGWDMQTFDNLVDNVCQAQETYLSKRTRGI